MKIQFDNTFQSEEHFYSYLVGKILYDNDIMGNVEYIDYITDFLDYIYVSMVDGKKYTIRTNSIFDTDDDVFVEYNFVY
jgi:hypothetical protein